MNHNEVSHIELGKSPILIFSNKLEDASYLSLLISNHLKSKFVSLKERSFSLTDHQFINPSIERSVSNALKDENSKGVTQQLMLLLDEGFDTKMLLGLSLPIQLLPKLELESLTTNALVIFLYNEFEPFDSLQEKGFAKLNEFYTTHTNQCMMLNSKLLISQPIEILQLLESKLDATIVNTSAITPHSKLTFDDEYKSLPSSDLVQGCKQLDSFLQFHTWLVPNNLVAIFPCLNSQLIDVFVSRYKELQCSFVFSIKCILICDSDLTITSLKKKLSFLEALRGELEFILKEKEATQQLNVLVQRQEAQYILFDNLELNLSYPQLFQSNPISFANVDLLNEKREIGLSDLLIRDIVQGNLFVTKESFVALQGFDSNIKFEFTYWDFCIRYIANMKKNIQVIPSQLIAISNGKDDASFVIEDEESYKQVLMKHHSLLESSLNELVELAGKQHFRSHHENHVLYSKIATLQLISSHAKDELKSLQQLTSQLHQRIQYLENNWYQKLRVKISRIKKIFFKKKSPGKGTLKRILQFIRFSFSKAGFGIVRKIIANILKRLFLLVEKRPVEIVYTDVQGNYGIYTYDDWIKEKVNSDQVQKQFDETFADIQMKPLISIIMPVYNTPARYLKEAIESIINQVYSNWELCIADDCSTDMKVKKMLQVYAAKDARIKVYFRKENGHISATSNDALRIATGEYVMLMDHDDLIPRNCIWEFVQSINQYPSADIFYSDEDKIDELRRHKDAHFKPDWAPDHLLSRNYLGHMTMLRKTILDSIGGFRIGFEGSQDYDLMLRATELSQQVIHIPKVLYHWRIHQLSAAQSEDVKPYAYIAAKKALEEALIRRNLKGDVKYLSGLRGYRIDYELQANDLVSIIIPTKDQTALLKNTIDSIFEITTYRNFEVIVLNNNSNTSEFENWRNEYSAKYVNQLKIVDAHFPFNFSKLMNIGAQLAKGTHLLLLNNDVEIIHGDWLTSMLSYTQQKRIGAVGAKLLYPDDTVQHAGVIVGLGGIAGHVFVGAYKDEAGYFNYIQSVNNFSAVTAACLLVRKEVFEAVGGMDETFEVEYNDVDFCLKIMKAGYNNVYLPQVELYHYESATRGHPHQSKVSYERHLREMKLFKDKWQDVIDHDPHYNPNLNLGVHDFSMNFSA